jgi:hypothetical protein
MDRNDFVSAVGLPSVRALFEVWLRAEWFGLPDLDCCMCLPPMEPQS